MSPTQGECCRFEIETHDFIFPLFPQSTPTRLDLYTRALTDSIWSGMRKGLIPWGPLPASRGLLTLLPFDLWKLNKLRVWWFSYTGWLLRLLCLFLYDISLLSHTVNLNMTDTQLIAIIFSISFSILNPRSQLFKCFTSTYSKTYLRKPEILHILQTGISVVFA